MLALQFSTTGCVVVWEGVILCRIQQQLLVETFQTAGTPRTADGTLSFPAVENINSSRPACEDAHYESAIGIYEKQLVPPRYV